MTASLCGKTVLVTGAESGLGQLIATHLLNLGAILAVTSRPEHSGRLSETFQREVAERRVFVLGIDLRDTSAVLALPATVVDAVGRLDVLINNAGVRHRGRFLDASAAEWEELVAVNMRAPYFLTQSSAAVMVATGTPGAVVNVASQLGVVAARDYSLYCISKAGLIAETKALAIELARHQISVNAVAPGPTNTARAGLLSDDDEALDFLRRMPIGRRIEPREVVEAVTYLAGQLGGAVTGHTLVVDGGWTIW